MLFSSRFKVMIRVRIRFGVWLVSSYIAAPTPWGTAHVPPFLHMAGHRGTVSRTANKKLTKLN